MAGRPKKKNEELKTYMLRIRMTDVDRSLLEQAAEIKRLQMSSWARAELVEAARQILKSDRNNSK